MRFGNGRFCFCLSFLFGTFWNTIMVFEGLRHWQNFKIYLHSCCWSKLLTKYYIMKGNTTYDWVWKQTNNKWVHRGHHCHVTPKCNWMSLSSIYGRIGICKTSKTTNKVIALWQIDIKINSVLYTNVIEVIPLCFS